MTVVTDRKTIVLVEQVRAPLGKSVIELPAGLIDEGETPVKAAKRELEEETGYTSGAAEVLCSGTSSPGLSDEINHFVKIRGAVRSGPGEKGITVHEVPLRDAQSWLKKQAAQGKVIDLKVYGGLYFAG